MISGQVHVTSEVGESRINNLQWGSSRLPLKKRQLSCKVNYLCSRALLKTMVITAGCSEVGPVHHERPTLGQ